jgi:hypothetical protein
MWMLIKSSKDSTDVSESESNDSSDGSEIVRSCRIRLHIPETNGFVLVVRKHWRDCLYRYIHISEQVPSKGRHIYCQRCSFASGLLRFANGKFCGGQGNRYHTWSEGDWFLERHLKLHGLIDSKESEHFIDEALNQFCPDGIDNDGVLFWMTLSTLLIQEQGFLIVTLVPITIRRHLRSNGRRIILS